MIVVSLITLFYHAHVASYVQETKLLAKKAFGSPS